LLAAAMTLGAVVFDMFEPSAAGAMLAATGQLGMLSWLAGEIELGQRLRRRSGLLQLEVSLIVAGALLVLARLSLLGDQLSSASGADHHLHAARVYDGFFIALALVTLASQWRARLTATVLSRLGQRPHLLLATSFALMILVSTILLCLPWSVHDVDSVSVVDGLFTATSAVCVTGLSVFDVGTHYTAFGQLVLLLSIQFGGIGIMTLGAAAVALVRDGSLMTQVRYASMLDVGHLADLRALVRTIVTTTFGIELVGALLLFWLWRDDPRLEGHSVAWYALFHSVSAFCNAGFALFPRNLADFTDSFGVQWVLMGLIVLGGLGFPVYRAMGQRARERMVTLLRDGKASARPYDYPSSVVLKTTGFLIVAGALFFLVLEWNGAMAGLDVGERAMAALFSSVTTRTAGFNTLDFGAFGAPALLATMGLMFIGGSPSSTAGGIKTTAASALFATFVGEMRGHEPRLSGRRLEPQTVRRASAVATLALVSLGVVLFLLTLTEEQEFLKLAFEAFSALGTVGLSTGITGELSTAGRLVLVLAMFIGRTGFMTVALAVGAVQSRERYRLPSADLPIW
jgi:trk system potassium uptake protein TrkH